MARHLRPTAEIAADVLLCADPGHALALAQRLFEKPLMANHNHGLWGYSGRTAAGAKLTIQAGGIGGPSTVIVLTELAEHGARRAIRVGTATALTSELALGEALVVAAALAGDGASGALEVRDPAPDPALTAEIVRVTSAPALTVASHDLACDPGSGRAQAWQRAGAAACDLETAAVLAAAARLGLAAAAAVAIAVNAAGELAPEAVEAKVLDLGQACAAALARTAADAKAVG